LQAIPQATSRHAPIIPPCPAALVIKDDKTWLAPVGRSLSHSWVESSLVTAKAAKRDNADVPSQLWEMPGAFLCFLMPKNCHQFYGFGSCGGQVTE
jgi:hypothetical protein